MKKSIAIAAALIAGTTLTNAANAGVRLGFGFPMGSFIAHENQSYSGRGGGDYERPRRAAPARKAYVPQQQAPKRTYVAPVVAQPKYVAPVQPVAQAQPASSAKIDTKLSEASAKADEKNVTEIAKTPADQVANGQPEVSTTAILARAPEGATKNGTSTATKEVTSLPEVVVETPKLEKKAEKTEKVAKTDKVASVSKSDGKKSDLQKVDSTSDDRKVCRRFSAAIAGLIDVPCE